jgi:hypothetical protein
MNLKCTICSEDLLENIWSTPCGHVYHINCVNGWLGKNKNCPQCRKPCRKKSLIQLFLSPNLEENEGPTAGSSGMGAQLNNLSGLNNKIDQISGVIENFGLTFSTWGTKNLQLTEQNCELKTQILGMQAENADLNQKLQLAQDNLAIERSRRRDLETTNNCKQVKESKTKANKVAIKNPPNRPARTASEPVAKKRKFDRVRNFFYTFRNCKTS